MSMKHATITVVEGNNFNNQPTDHQMYAHVSEVVAIMYSKELQLAVNSSLVQSCQDTD